MSRNFVILISMAILMMGAGCQQETLPDNIAVAEPKDPIYQIVDALRNDPRRRHPPMLLVPEQATAGSIPHAMSSDFFSSEGRSTPDEFTEKVNSLMEGELGMPWESEVVDEINAKLSVDTDFRFTVSKPIQIPKGESNPWYCVVEKFEMLDEKRKSRVFQAGVFTFRLRNGTLVEPEWEPYLTSSRVGKRKR